MTPISPSLEHALTLLRASLYAQLLGGFVLICYLLSVYSPLGYGFETVLIACACCVVALSYYLATHFWLKRGSRLARGIYLGLCTISSLNLLHYGFTTGYFWATREHIAETAMMLYWILIHITQQVSALLMYNPDADCHFQKRGVM